MRAISGDRVFFFIVVILVVGGIAMFASASLGLLAREGDSPWKLAITQLVLGLIPGIAALLAIRYAPPTWIQKLAPIVYIGSIGLTALVFIPGIGGTYNGATRWIDLGFTTVQPAEFLKIGVILMLAWYLSKMKGKLDDIRTGLIPFGLIVGIPSVMLLLQPNTSTVMVMGLTAVALYLLAGAPWRDILLIIAGAVLVLAVLVMQRPYLMSRVATFMNPADNSLTSGYQIQQSLIAIGSGGFMGRGFGQSAQKFNYLPEPVGDSVFAVYSEEFGFVGAAFMVLLFAGFAMRGFAIAADAATVFGSLAATGLTLLISLSAFLNIGAMLAILPLTGLPLPFVSHGGTALLVALASVGVILNVAAHRKQGRKANA
ncbi:MAG TPA: putative peptidoglycan glycosyltransferase FtsW [Candidatus Paceibacterota bacterium]|nr:putative peptidoglycan glycosyltransferase FtsW [Candidatus Paceibacterota bacterium]